MQILIENFVNKKMYIDAFYKNATKNIICIVVFTNNISHISNGFYTLINDLATE